MEALLKLLKALRRLRSRTRFPRRRRWNSLDNDEAGEDACDGMMDTLEDMGYDVERLRPEGKDWNDDLRAKRGGHG